MKLAHIGSCKLCLRVNQRLQDSHLIPRGIYKIARKNKQDPVSISRKKAIQTSRQTKAYLLCRPCEQRLNDNGEAWVLRNCWRSETHYPLLARLKAAEPTESDDRSAVFAGGLIDGVDMNKLAYFGASVFWRAGVHRWSRVGSPPSQLPLDGHEEGLRRFLLGEPFPLSAALLVSVSCGMDMMPNAFTVFPFIKDRREDTRQFKCFVGGMTFQLVVGEQSLPKLLRFCSVRAEGRPLLVSLDTDRANRQDIQALLASMRSARRR